MGGERMTGILSRRRAAMMVQQAAPEPGGTPITGLEWTSGRTISGTNGAVNTAAYSAATINDRTPVPAGVTTVKFTGTASYDGTTINVFCHEYEGATWKRRLANMNSGAEVSLTSTTTGVRFTFAFGANSGKTMTQAIIDQCFAAEWIE